MAGLGMAWCSVAVAVAVAALAAAPAEAVNVTAVGEPVVVWAAVDTLHECGHIDVPDTPARAYVDSHGLVHMFTDTTQFYTLNGPSLLNVTRNCSLAYNSTYNPDPAMFAGDEFVDAPFSFGNGTVVALFHTEFPGNRFGNCTGPSYPHCWTVTIGLGVSHDWGYTWEHARPPPHHLVAAVPYGYNGSQLAYGWGDPSNIVQSPRDKLFYFAMWNRNQVGLQPPGICIVRTANLMDPSSWRGWGGSGFTVPFVSPYTMAPGTEAEHVCQPVNLPAPDCAAMGLVWSTYLERFIVTLGCWKGPYLFSTSEDLVHWEPAQPLYDPRPMKEVVSIMYPSLMDPASPRLGDPNFHTVGQEPYLFWASTGHSPYSDGRHLWATPMRFTK